MTDRLYRLLPAFYRERDATQGEPLRALLAGVEAQLELLEDDIAGLYADWFVETCAEWAVPYLGELLGTTPLVPVRGTGYSARADVADTVDARRRKGTIAALEQLARDVTGWPAVAVEYFERLGTTQHVNHVRPDHLRTPDLRSPAIASLAGNPFDTTAHTVDVRRIAKGTGKYDLPNVGLHLYRVPAYPVTWADALEGDAGLFYFNGIDAFVTLFGASAPVEEMTTTRVTEASVPAPLRPRALHDRLQAMRTHSVPSDVDADATAARSLAALSFAIRYRPDEYSDWIGVAPEAIAIGTFALDPAYHVPVPRTDWTGRTYRSSSGEDVPQALMVDPRLGLMQFNLSAPPSQVQVCYRYGRPADLGGGAYAKEPDPIGRLLERPPTWHRVVTGGGKAFADAVAAWNDGQGSDGRTGVIAIADSRTYWSDGQDAEQPIEIRIGRDERLLIVGATWNDPEDPDTLSGDTVQPTLYADVVVVGQATSDQTDPGWIAFENVRIAGMVSADREYGTGRLGRITLSHVLGAGLTTDEGSGEGHSGLVCTVRRSLVEQTPVGDVESLHLEESVVFEHGHGHDPYSTTGAVDTGTSPLRIDRCTLLGRVTAGVIDASDTIFAGTVKSARRQQGCVRYSYLAPDSEVARRFRCQPDLAVTAWRDAGGAPEEVGAVRTRTAPVFTSTDVFSYAFVQLAAVTPVEIRTGASDGAEMGVYAIVQQPQREANLATRLREFLGARLKAGVFQVT